MAFGTRQVCCSLIILFAGCGSERRDRPSAAAPRSDAGAVEQPQNALAPPPNCVANAPPCIHQLDCTGAAGTRCNTELDLPVCQTIRCGAEGSACSEDALCPSGMTCLAGRCGTCPSVPEGAVCIRGEPVCVIAEESICGPTCVDLDTSLQHCGRCNRPVSNRQTCDNGEPRCFEGLELCGTECVDLRTDERHCGACNTPARGFQCFNGDPGCGPEQDCAGTCTPILEDENNCGGCDLSCDYLATLPCPSGMSCRRTSVRCREANCRMEVTSTMGACDDKCGQIGGVCVQAGFTSSPNLVDCSATSANRCVCLFPGI